MRGFEGDVKGTIRDVAPAGAIEQIARMVEEGTFLAPEHDAGDGGDREGYRVLPARAASLGSRAGSTGPRAVSRPAGYREAGAPPPLRIASTDASARRRGLADIVVWHEAGHLRWRADLRHARRVRVSAFVGNFLLLEIVVIVSLMAAGHAAMPVVLAVTLVNALVLAVPAMLAHARLARAARDTIERALTRAAENARRAGEARPEG